MSPTTFETDVLLPSEAAKLLRVNESWLREKVRTRTRDKIPHVRIGKFLRFSRKALTTWLEAQAVVPTARKKVAR